MKKFLLYIREYLWRARLKTCLCVFPLRAGLFCLASLNVLIAVLQIVGTATGATSFLPVLAHVQSEALGGEDHSPGACVLPPSALLAFSSVLLAALYRRDVVLLGLYCCYVLGSIFLSLVVYGLLNSVINPLDLFLIILDTIYQIYIMVLARSLMIEIELENAGEKHGYVYNKDQGVVIIRDVESPPPGVGVVSYPALTEPGMTTSITTLATLHEGPEYERYNANRTNTLQSNTLRSYRAQDIDNNQRSATLPYKDTAFLQRQNAHRIGAVQSLAGPATFKTVGSTIHSPVTTIPAQINTSNADSLTKENTQKTVTTTAVIETNTKQTSTKEETTKPDNKADQNEEIIKTDEVPEKKKRGIFTKAQKEEKTKKNDDKAASLSTSKPSTSQADTSKKGTDDTDTKVPEGIKDDTSIEKDKKEASQKKKRGLFKKSEKEKDKKTKKGKVEKNEESQETKDIEEKDAKS